MYVAAISRSSAGSETLKNFFSAVSGLPADPGSDCCDPTTDASHHGADRAPRQGDRSILGPLGETQMRKISLVAAIALMLAGVGVWAASITQARIDVPAGAQFNPLQITMGARPLPVAHYDDYSLVFN
jgi:hypothetical protein